MTDPGIGVLKHANATGHRGHNLGQTPDSATGATRSRAAGATSSPAAGATGGSPASGNADARAGGATGSSLTGGDMDPRAADALVRTFYEENAPFMITYVAGLLNDRHLAEDVVQETMLRAWRHCEGFSSEKGSVRGWLIRVAHNIAMDKLRMRRSRPIEVAETSGPEPQVGDHAEAVVTALHIQQALARLSPGHRDVLQQVYMNGLTAGEAAAVLGIPEGTVFSRAYYGLRMLRRELGVPPRGTERMKRDAGPATLAA
jgi:RNA polymerase sigma-70 factor, ECF subfamily